VGPVVSVISCLLTTLCAETHIILIT